MVPTAAMSEYVHMWRGEDLYPKRHHAPRVISQSFMHIFIPAKGLTFAKKT